MVTAASIVGMDYRKPLLQAMTNYAATASCWNTPSVKTVCSTIAARALAGPISAEQTIYLLAIMPPSFEYTFAAIKEVKGTGPASLD